MNSSSKALKPSALSEAGGTKEQKYHVHRNINGNAWIIRKDREYGDKFPSYPSLEEAIVAVRQMMKENNIYKLTIHTDKKLLVFEERLAKRLVGLKKAVKNTRITPHAKSNRLIAIPKIPGREVVMNIAIG